MLLRYRYIQLGLQWQEIPALIICCEERPPDMMGQAKETVDMASAAYTPVTDDQARNRTKVG
jgi:hypothetical protein